MAKNLRRLALGLGAVVAATSVFTVASRSGAGDAMAPRQADDAAVAMVSREQAQLQQAGILAAAGRSAIEHLAAARQAVTNAKSAQARRHLEAAKEILAHIGEILGSSAKDGRDAEDKAEHLVPLYARLRLQDAVTLSAEGMRRLDGIAPLVARGEHSAVVEQLRRSGLPLAYSYVELPLEPTEVQVAGALAALDGDETERALGLISAAEDNLVSQVITVGRSGEDTSAPRATPAVGATAAQTAPAQG